MGTMQNSEEILGEVLDSIHSNTFKVIPDGGNGIKMAKYLFRGRVDGSWVHDVPHHGDLPVGDGDTHKYFVSQVTSSDGVERTFVCVTMTVRTYKMGQGSSEAPRIAGYYEVQDFTAAEEHLEPLALALIPTNTIRQVEELEDIFDLL